MRLALALAAMVVASPGMAQDLNSLSIADVGFNRDNARHDPTAIFKITNGAAATVNYIVVKCTAFDAIGVAREIATGMVSNVKPNKVVNDQVWFLTNIPSATTAACRIEQAM